MKNNTLTLPEMSPEKFFLTYQFPNVLTHIEYDERGFGIATVREGGSRQVEHLISTEFSEDEVDETKQLFVVRAQNKISFGGQTIDALTDAVGGSKPLGETSPTASEYQKLVGKEVLIGFNCEFDELLSRQMERTIYRVTRSKIILQ